MAGQPPPRARSPSRLPLRALLLLLAYSALAASKRVDVIKVGDWSYDGKGLRSAWHEGIFFQDFRVTHVQYLSDVTASTLLVIFGPDYARARMSKNFFRSLEEELASFYLCYHPMPKLYVYLARDSLLFPATWNMGPAKHLWTGAYMNRATQVPMQRPHSNESATLYWIPLGFNARMPFPTHDEFFTDRSSRVHPMANTPIQGRKVLTSFYGSVQNDSKPWRLEQIQDLQGRRSALRRAQRGDIKLKILTEKGHGMAISSYMQSMLESKTVLCLEGMRRESYRIWEALECGSVPLLVFRELPGDATTTCEAHDRFDCFLHDLAPRLWNALPKFTDASHLVEWLLRTGDEELEALRRELLARYFDMKMALRSHWRGLLRRKGPSRKKLRRLAFEHRIEADCDAVLQRHRTSTFWDLVDVRHNTHYPTPEMRQKMRAAARQRAEAGGGASQHGAK